LIAVGLVLIIIAAVSIWYLLKDLSHEQFMDYSKASILIMSNMYGTIVLVTLLSYGLAFLPFSIWKRSNNYQIVYESLMSAE